MRLIDADALLDKVQDYGEGQERLLLIDPYWVRKAPTIARPHGEWLTEPHSRIMHCSKCGAEENLSKLLSAKWCYSCGSDMRKVGDKE